jgi:hypothetical protein
MNRRKQTLVHDSNHPLTADCFAIACRATDGFQAKRIIDNWIGLYNPERPHTALDKRTPDFAYFGNAETRKAA